MSTPEQPPVGVMGAGPVGLAGRVLDAREAVATSREVLRKQGAGVMCEAISHWLQGLDRAYPVGPQRDPVYRALPSKVCVRCY